MASERAEARRICCNIYAYVELFVAGLPAVTKQVYVGRRGRGVMNSRPPHAGARRDGMAAPASRVLWVAGWPRPSSRTPRRAAFSKVSATPPCEDVAHFSVLAAVARFVSTVRCWDVKTRTECRSPRSASPHGALSPRGVARRR